jgi:hypothetical protein
MGPADRADVRVRWPGGATGAWSTVTADQQLTIEREVSGP